MDHQEAEIEVNQKLVFDIGFHVGEDAAFYLKRGFKVVAVEANPALCDAARERFASEIASGQLILVNKALAATPGKLVFYVSEHSVWSTCDETFAARSREAGYATRPITVEATTIAHLIEEHGVPYFMKVDIEGFDMVVIEGLLKTEARPAYISLESDKDSVKGLRREFDTLAQLGYDRFKRVNQAAVPKQAPRGVEGYAFPPGASGNFGEDAPGRWQDAKRIFEGYWLTWMDHLILGDYRIAPRWLQSVWWRLGRRPGWWDTHAKHASVA